MISLLAQEYSLLNIIVICIQIFCPLVLYLISVLYITEEQDLWIRNKAESFTFTFLNDTKGMFVGAIVFTLVGMAVLLVLDFYYRKHSGLEVGKSFHSFLKSDNESGVTSCIDKIGFAVFPITIILSVLGRVVTLQTKSFVTEMVLYCSSLPCIAFLMYLYSTRVSYTISSLLAPLLAWNILNIIAITPVVKPEDSGNSS